MVNLSKAAIRLSAFVALILTLSCTPIAKAEDHVEQADKSRWLSPPTYAIKSVREAHSSQTPVIVEQGELDALINPGGGGACPISAALIALQTLRSMTGQLLQGNLTSLLIAF